MVALWGTYITSSIYMSAKKATVESDKMRSKYSWMAAPFIFVIFWSGGYKFAKLGLMHIEPKTMLTIRYGIAAIILLPCIFWVPIEWPTEMQDWFIMVITGLLIQCVYFNLTYLALSKV